MFAVRRADDETETIIIVVSSRCIDDNDEGQKYRVISIIKHAFLADKSVLVAVAAACRPYLMAARDKTAHA